MEKEKVIKSYKGFDKDLKCRDFQYEIGKEYETNKAKCCETGFHACEYPLDCLGYYEPTISRYCEVEQSGEIDKDNDGDTKASSTKIKIGAEIGIAGLVKASFNYVKEKCIDNKTNHSRANNRANSATGSRSANSATGSRSANSVTGSRSANSVTGSRSANSATGSRSANSATGDWSANSATGSMSANSATGDWSANSATGDWSANSATGSTSANSATGSRSANSATGDWSANSATGDWSANSATGDWSANSATGYGSANISTGSECKNNGMGEANISVGWGKDNKCKGKIGSYIVCSEWGDYNYSTHRYNLLSAKMAMVDGEIIKEDTYYTLKNGEFVEVEND